MRTKGTMMKSSTFLAAFLMAASTCFGQGAAQQQAPELEALFHKGESAYKNGAYAEAIDLYSQVLKSDPEYLNAYLQRGFCHSLQREYQAAVDDFSSVISRKNDHLWAYTSRGSAYNKLGKPELAIKDFNRVLELDPKNQEAYNNRGWAKKAIGDGAGACNDWKSSRKMGNAEAKIILMNNRCK
jgi:tetratricopeptide (TPR) repeat protein